MDRIRRWAIRGADPRWDAPYTWALVTMELILCLVIVRFVPYTEIDWIAYNEEVDAWRGGELDYRNIRGGTGPLVYPAGFLYLYGFIQWLTDRSIPRAQRVFVVLYVANSAILLSIYTAVLRARTRGSSSSSSSSSSGNTSSAVKNASVVWSWRIAMAACCLSKRVHSIYVLRLFNDGPAMLLLHISLYFFAVRSWWKVGCVFFSAGVAVKMNILLFAPGLLLLLLQAHYTHSEPLPPGLPTPTPTPRTPTPPHDVSYSVSYSSLYGTAVCLSICAGLQVVLGLPFLLSHPVSYLRRAFELDRAFFYKWTVNWKCLSEEAFVSVGLSRSLLLLHLTTLGLFTAKWLRPSSGRRRGNDNRKDLSPDVVVVVVQTLPPRHRLSPEYVCLTMFLSNYVGIVFARTLHYQFYSWYYQSLPLLLWCSADWMGTRVILLLGIEYAFNVFPATPVSSALLQVSQVLLLALLAQMKVPPMYVYVTK